MSAVTSQPLPFDRLEREQHIQMIFRAFRNRCGPACEFHGHSPESKLHHALHWGSDDPLSSASVRVAEHPLAPVSRREAKDQQCGAAAASCFISMLETVEKIHITTRLELQGESENLNFLSFGVWGQICMRANEHCHRCRPAVCPQEDLQHHHRREQLTVGRRRGRCLNFYSTPSERLHSLSLST